LTASDRLTALRLGLSGMIGGVISSFLLELMVYPAIYEIWRGREMRKTKEALL
jgi:Cu/Ag efflux pump CusA